MVELRVPGGDQVEYLHIKGIGGERQVLLEGLCSLKARIFFLFPILTSLLR